MAVLLYERAGATAILTLNRPRQRNALDDDLRAALAEAIAAVRDDASVKAVVLAGAGGHFCAGGDVKAMAAQPDGAGSVFLPRQRMQALQRWFDTLVDLEKPVIAAVEGAAFGAGLSLALAADFVLAAPGAVFSAVFARVGLVPDAGAMYLLPRAVGLSRAKELVFTGREVSAQEAADIGLAHAVSQGDVRADALALAARFHAAPTEALGLAKAVMNRAFETERGSIYAQEALAQAVCRQSAFHQDAVQRFAERRPAAWRWDASAAGLIPASALPL
ncbi:MAG: enoyl-CoA hydratase/isomerase family protein [Pseudomonadota bacterium]